MAAKGKQLISALESVQKAMAEAQKDLVPASEALAPYEGRILKPLQYDRMRVNLPTNELGGPEYSLLSLINDPHAAAGTVAAVSNKTALSRLVNQYKDLKPGSVIHVPMLGSEIQHRGNPTMFAKLHNEFMDKVKAGEVEQDKIDAINNKLNSIEIGPKGKKKPLFPEPVDVTSPEFLARPLTFEQRTQFADVVGGQGVGGKKGQVIDLTSRLGETIDPYIANAPTGAFGHRIVELGTNTLYDPTLHGDYPYHIIGKDMGVRFNPIEKEYITDFAKQIMEDPKKARLPTDMDFRTGDVSQRITPEWLQFLKDKGNKDGGPIHSDGSLRLAGGGSARKTYEAILKAVEAADLPTAANSARTQIVGTMPTYEKARDILGKEGIEGADVIDYGAGKGLGSTMMKAHSFEPYPQGWYPTYTKSEDIPSENYRGLLNLNVLNVLDPERRAHAVEEMGRIIKPEGGIGLITTRGKDVMSTIGGRPGPEPMSVITSRETYQKGFHPEELRSYIQHILGSDYEYEPLNLGQAGVKIKKKADGGSIQDDSRRIVEDPVKYLMPEIPPVGDVEPVSKSLNPILGAIEGYRKSGQFLKSLGKQAIGEAKEEAPRSLRDVSDIANDYIANYGGAPVDLVNMALKPVGLSSEKPFLGSDYIRSKMVDAGIHSGTERPLIGAVTSFATPSGIARAGASAVKGYGNLIKEGIERNIHRIEPRMGIIKEPGGMLVGGEKELDRQMEQLYKNESIDNYDGTYGTDPHAAALNNWVNTKVRKYVRNQAGSENDPILKAIESGVQHNFPPALGDSKYMTKVKRAKAGFPEEGTATTDLGKEWQYKVDEIFNPHSSEDIKKILHDPIQTYTDPATETRSRLSKLRIEHDLPVHKMEDIELINQIPDKTVYTIGPQNIPGRLGLGHIRDVLYEDLQTGKLRPEQLDQMSMDKAVRRAAEYDAQKAREMVKAHATSVEGMPVPKQYDDGFKWVELKHGTDKEKTAAALKSEGEMMGHCVGSYCPQVESGHTKIYSLRGPDNKSHVTIEVTKKNHLNDWLDANKEEIEKDPLLKQMAYYDPDEKYPGMYSQEEVEQAYINDITKMLRAKGAPVHEAKNTWMDIEQVKGKQNKRPDDKYQKYVSDFIKNNPTGHEIADIHELNNTNLMSAQDLIGTGLVPKDIHFHPDVERALGIKYRTLADKMKDPRFSNEISDEKYELFKDAARDFAGKNIHYFDKEDLLNHIRDKYSLPKKAKGGPIDLETDFKIRRRYG